MVINTGIKATPKFREILGSVIGQMSDGIWENTRSMEKYWKSLRYDVDPAGYIIIEDRHYVCSNPVDFFANKIKQIVKIEADDNPRYGIQWSRSCSAATTYLNYHENITIGDCYELYERLKGRDTTKYSYASYEPYRVNLEYAGVSFDITVEALNQSDAKAKAIKKFAEQATCTIYK
jgi:hypothetical protein